MERPLFQDDDDFNTAYRGVKSTRPNERDEKVPPKSRDAVRIAIRRLKTNKGSSIDYLPGELFKA